MARISSNFFGTQFNCCLENRPFKNNGQYPAPSGKKERIITVEFETNIFGMSGPRKMSAFIGDGSYHYPLS